MRAYDGVVRRRGVSAAQPPTSGWSPGTCWARSYSPIKPGREPHLRRTPRFVTPWLYGRTKSRRERRHRHAAFGFGPQDVARIRPGIVYVSLCAYGHEGPWADRRGFDSLGQTASGFNAAEAEASGVRKSKPLPAQALDHATG
jgi:hypothetical protein